MAEFPPVEEFDEEELIREAAARAAAAADAATASAEDPHNGPEDDTKDAFQVEATA